MSFIPAKNIAQRVYQWKKESQGPISLEIYPTLKCNLDCQFCDTTDRHRPAVNEMSASEWCDIIKEAKDIGVQEVFVLGGGEPFVHVGIMTILQTIKELGLYGILTTNGTLINKERSQQLLDMQWDEIHFSIDGATSMTHDKLRGRRGSFKKTVSTLCRLGQKRNYDLRLAIHTVITNRNYFEIPQVVELAYAVGAQRVDFDDLISYTPEQRQLELSQTQRTELRNIALTGMERAKELKIETTLEQYISKDNRVRGHDSPSTEKNLPKGKGLDGAPCLKPFYHLTLTADGKISPCCVLAGQGSRLFDMQQPSLTKVWHDDAFLQLLRKRMIEHNPIDRCRECSNNILNHESYIRSHFPK